MVYVNDLPNEQKANAKLFADEASLFSIVTPIQIRPFCGYSRMERGQKRPLPKICHTYPTTMKLRSYNLPIEGPKNV